MNYITGNSFFPNAIAPAFMTSLALVFYIGLGLSLAAAVSSLLRGKMYIYDKEAAAATSPNVPLPLSTVGGLASGSGSYEANTIQSDQAGESVSVPSRKEKEESE